ncbi:hypothetical protein MMG00_05655 [Ignatzschineria rhizosphaerae]|uniref:Uncharacterized protein n=1 Tax=Ignatzschineria rhizosphaerae TaxID=2923279 RepID=A0ABY3X3B0_9GAMM|nr:hypothetical protein [Ignatzschineria rhizosphaerae]UNM97334.1 hypothetical protein MMG00_05655 [Ignatzschineria rhizosphaerae]
MRILLVMLFSFILAACGEKSVDIEVHGIRIGAPIGSVEDLESYTQQNVCEITIYHKSPFGVHADGAIFELGGKVAAVSVRIDGEDEIRNYIDFMTENYGDPDITLNSLEEDDYKFNPKGGLSKIEAYMFSPSLAVLYTTEEIDSIAYDVFDQCDE